MRVLFTSYGPRPHSYPMVPLAWAFRVMGHDVRMAGPPAISDPMAESGLVGAVVGEDADVSSFLSGGKFRPRPPGPDETAEDALARFIDGVAPIAFLRCEAMAGDLVALARSWRPDLIIYDPVTFAGPVAAQVLGVPAVCNLYGMVRQFRIEMEGIAGAVPRPEYVSQFKKHDVPELLEPAAWIDPCPPSLRWRGPGAVSVEEATPRLSMAYVRYSGPGAVPGWLSGPAARPRVLVTWGTTSERKLGGEVLDQARRVVEALAPMDVEVLVTTGAMSAEDQESFRRAASHVRIVEWLPFHAMAETSAAVVHTGGTGAMLTSAACGVPQLGISAIPEGTFNSEMVAAAGAGLHIAAADADVGTVRAALAELLGTPAYRKSAALLRAEIEAQPSPAAVVRSLESLVKGASHG
jgi:UDP:flavonoid glycosyltransferase YjiC (YdhE family)